MSDNKILDFQAGKESQLHKRREARLDGMRQAFRVARVEADRAAKPAGAASASKGKRRKSKK